jgi:hypothetical protein
MTTSIGIVNPGYVDANALLPQQLYTVSLMPPIVYTSPGNSVTILTANADVSIGSAVTLVNGVVGLLGNLTYQLTAAVDVNNVNFVTEPKLQWYDTTLNVTVGQAGSIDRPLTEVYTPTANTTVVCKAIAPTAWVYPATLNNAVLTVQVIDGYTVTVANI